MFRTHYFEFGCRIVYRIRDRLRKGEEEGKGKGGREMCWVLFGKDLLSG